MLSLRITAPNGSVRIVALDRPDISIGRAAGNTVVLETGGVSSQHCAVVMHGAQAMLEDRGSTNGTFVNNARIQQPVPLAERDRIYVGQYLIEVIPATSKPHSLTVPIPSSGPAPVASDPGGGRLIMQRGDRSWRDTHNRIGRYAEQWEEAGRPDRLALRPEELRGAEAWLTQTDPSQQAAVTPLQRELIAASRGANQRRALRRALSIVGGVLLLGGLVTAVVLLWPEPTEDPVATDQDPIATDQRDEPDDEHDDEEDDGEYDDDDGGSIPEPDDRIRLSKTVLHQVIPEETLDDIAQRYGVTVAKIAKWNLLNPDAPNLDPGKTIKIKQPTKRPLPQQKIDYDLEPEDNSWSKLSKRFGISAKKLRSYNPDVTKLAAGSSVVIWIDPRPYKPAEPRRAIPKYVPLRTAQAVGSPNSGRLEGGIQIPESPLYKRRYAYIMWGSGYLVANVQTAVAQFRQDMDFDGTLVLADTSKQRGGHFNPHKSHQTGRDIDIWLPTLRGVFKEKYLTEGGAEKWGRRPNPEEADWFATWGLVRALIATDAVQVIFLDHSVQPNVYNAAKFLGVSDEELDISIQYPRSKNSSAGMLSHSAAHIHHMHVRFKCAPYENECKRRNARTPN